MATLYPDNIIKRHLFGEAASYPIRKISLSDLTEALRLGWEDFQAMPSHAIVVCVIYPVLGLVLFRMVLGYSVLPLLFPLAAGFALIGPFAAIGLYELSRRRERGEEVDAWDAIKVLRAPSFGAMVELGVLLLVLFGAWIGVANAIYVTIFGHAAAASIPDFATRVLTTPEGWSLVIVGCGCGFLFAVVALCVSVVSFPLMLDRHATAIDAIRTSLRAVAAESGCDGRMGPHRRGAARDRLAAVLRRSRCRPAGARSCHLAPLSAGGRAESESTGRAAAAPEGKALRSGLSGQSLPVEPRG